MPHSKITSLPAFQTLYVISWWKKPSALLVFRKAIKTNIVHDHMTYVCMYECSQHGVGFLGGVHMRPSCGLLKL
jgi:hypothetical protein